jgi:hypothetical protein
VARIFADDAKHVLPLDDAAVFAKAFNGSSDFHVIGFGRNWRRD